MSTIETKVETPSTVVSGIGVGVGKEPRATATANAATTKSEFNAAMARLISTTDGGGGLLGRDTGWTEYECMEI